MSGVTSTDRPIPLPHAVHMELVKLSNAVSVKRVELENAQLREELAIRRILDALGLSGQKVRVDLDTGLVDIVRDAEASA